MNDDHHQRGGQPDDEERYVRDMQEWEQRRADRSDDQWWKEDHLCGGTGEQLDDALKTLVAGCRCDVGRLLSDLREIESLSAGYQLFSRRNLPAVIRQMRDLAGVLWAIEQSPVGHMVPPKLLISSAGLRSYADALESARKATSRSNRPQRAKRIVQLVAYVDSRVPEHGDIGKKDADVAIAILLAAVTRQKWTGAALRMARSRANKNLGRKRVPKDPRRVVHPLRGSRAKPRRRRRFVGVEVYRQEKEREQPDEPSDVGQPSDDREDPDDHGEDD